MVQPGKNPNSVGKKIPSLLINSSFLAAQIHHCQVTLQVPAEWKRIAPATRRRTRNFLENPLENDGTWRFIAWIWENHVWDIFHCHV